MSGGGGGGGGGGVPGQHGGIIRRRTRLLAGEAGPEALIPLARLHEFFEPAESSETTVIVNSPHPATVRESRRGSQREIEVVIDDAIARSFRTGGRASQALESSFGVRRVGGTR